MGRQGSYARREGGGRGKKLFPQEANGLLDPIVLHEGKILDGRNRYRACLQAGIEIRTVEWSGECGTPRGFVKSRITRRNLTKSQEAMGLARLFPEAPDRGGRGKKRSVLNTEVSDSYVKKARFVLSHAPDLVDPVLVGAKPLNAAYDEAKGREREAASDQSRLAKLREVEPELATKVEERRVDDPARKIGTQFRFYGSPRHSAWMKRPCDATSAHAMRQKPQRVIQKPIMVRAPTEAVRQKPHPSLLAPKPLRSWSGRALRAREGARLRPTRRRRDRHGRRDHRTLQRPDDHAIGDDLDGPRADRMELHRRKSPAVSTP